MSEVEVNGKPSFKSRKKGNPDVKPTKNQQEVDLEAKEFEKELRKQRDELKAEQVEETTEESPRSQELTDIIESEVIDPQQKFNLTADELAKIITAAQGGDTEPHLALRMPEDLTPAEKVGYVMDDALAEVGRGLHRVADGARDVVGGAIDIITLGRANRK